MDKLTWKVEGSDRLHTIPDDAVICATGVNGRVLVWVDEYEVVCYEDLLDVEQTRKLKAEAEKVKSNPSDNPV